MGQLCLISIEVKHLGDPVWLRQRRVNVDVAVAATRGEVLVSQFVQGNDLSDGLSVCPLLNRQLVATMLAEDDEVALTLATDQKLTLLA